MHCLFLALCIGSAQSFAPVRGPVAIRHQPPSSAAMQLQSTMKPNELFDSPGWGPIEEELDQVPIFAVANEAGQPVKYRIEKGDEAFEVPLFYTHVDDALKELDKTKETSPDTKGMDINPYPLGGIFKMWASDEA